MQKLATDDHSRGPHDAELTVVQYGDYDCPHTRAAAPIIRAIIAASIVPTRFVFRHFPLRHLHANAQVLSEIAEAAATLGPFWETHDRLMSHRMGITQEDVFHDLRAANVDVDELQRLLGSPAVVERIERDVKGGAASGVHSTPTWFFNGTRWDGHYDRDTLEEQIQRATRRS